MKEIVIEVEVLVQACLALVATVVVVKLSQIVLKSEFWVSIPSVRIEKALSEVPEPGKKFDLAGHEASAKRRQLDLSIVKCWDPCTLDDLGEIKTTSPEEVKIAVNKARIAQKEWAKSSWTTRRRLLKVMLKWCVEDQERLAAVAVRDSGKTLTDAVFGEILVTCEKLKWLAENAEDVLKPEPRAPGTTVVFTKKVRVEYPPLGVIGAIVPWNYPFHNVLNPTSAALAAGNGIVIKVSEYASWSTRYIGEGIRKCLAAVGAPTNLVQFVHGYADTGSALVSSGVDKLIFVGSPQVGKKVMETAANTLTPVVLELGGKDPFVICDDIKITELERIVQVALRGVFQSMGQNCAGPERFYVASTVYESFCYKVAQVANKLTVGASNLEPEKIDCGAVTMGTPSILRLQALVDDAVARGAKILCGGSLKSLESHLSPSSKNAVQGSFYPPTILANVPDTAKIATEEIFGPIMCIFSPHDSDEQVIQRINACPFALSSCAFAQDPVRARNLADKLDAGMSSVNDLEGTTYLSQSLPFGGLKESGFDRFAGPEGLRGLCALRSVCEDKFPNLLRTAIPGPMQYPSKGKSHVFAQGIVELFYGFGLKSKLHAITNIIKAAAA